MTASSQSPCLLQDLCGTGGVYWARSVVGAGSNSGQNNVRVWPGNFLWGQCMDMYSVIFFFNIKKWISRFHTFISVLHHVKFTLFYFTEPILPRESRLVRRGLDGKDERVRSGAPGTETLTFSPFANIAAPPCSWILWRCFDPRVSGCCRESLKTRRKIRFCSAWTAQSYAAGQEIRPLASLLSSKFRFF